MAKSQMMKATGIPTRKVTAPTDILKPKAKAPVQKSAKAGGPKPNRNSTNTLKGDRTVKTGKNNTDQHVSNNGTPHPGKSKSTRIVYKTLRTLRKGGK